MECKTILVIDNEKSIPDILKYGFDKIKTKARELAEQLELEHYSKRNSGRQCPKSSITWTSRQVILPL